MPDDCLLDLCCGNGALSSRIIGKCDRGLGVDFSEYLIQIAHRYFANTRQEYVVQDVVDFCNNTADATKYTKAFCYGAFCYLSPAQANQLLSSMRCRFDNLQRVFIGNLADRNKANLFHGQRGDMPDVLDDPCSTIGYWWDERTFINLAQCCGWKAVVSRMPSDFYGSHYRFDVTLLPDSTCRG